MVDDKLHILTNDFYKDYSTCKEILEKTRPYCIATIKVDGYTYGIPFRTNIHHKFSYIFKGSPRSENSGLDFSKAVIILKPTYIGPEAIIDSFEYSIFVQKKTIIANRFENFIRDYKKWVTNPIYFHKESLMEKTSLQYFHKELGLS